MISSCLPAPGLTYKKLSRLEESLDCFLKLHAILRNSAQVMYQLASLYPDDVLCHVFICSKMFALNSFTSHLLLLDSLAPDMSFWRIPSRPSSG